MNKLEFDWRPLALVPALALLAFPLIGSGSTWLTLTVAGLAMGMIIFIIASGLTLVFGLMDVLNFGHGVFIALGAYVATSVLAGMGDWTMSAELWRNLVALALAMTVGMLVAGAVGLAFERYSGPKGFTADQFRETAEEVAGKDLKEWFRRALNSTEELDYAEALEWYGLQFTMPDPNKPNQKWKLALVDKPTPEQAAEVIAMGGQGVGLYRTEYLYLMNKAEPTEREHFQAYKKAVEGLKGRMLTIRTVDLGADKLTQSKQDTPERNPFLGNRSIRYCLRNLPMFKLQLRAILRASALGPIKVMFPLVTSLSELRRARHLLNDVMEDLAEDSIPFDEKIQVGMMVEVPSAALMADAFSREVDFFSIGTNDLIQYTLAVDRTNERIADLYTPMHPAVLRLIRDVTRMGRRRKINVSCCGEAAADLEFALLLMGLGMRTLSVSSSAIPSLKRLVRSVKIEQCERIARTAMAFANRDTVFLQRSSNMSPRVCRGTVIAASPMVQP